ncbi:MAG: DUF3616 domain-containing protein [Cyanobacteria bacterium J06638_28]
MAPTPVCLKFADKSDLIRTSLSAVIDTGQHLWLGCDETATLERLTLDGAQAIDHQHFQVADFLDLPHAEEEEIDIEGLAYADYYLWFVGSHSLKRKAAKPDKSPQDKIKRLRKIEREDNRYTLGRIPLVDGQLLKACPHPQKPDMTLAAAQLKRKKSGNELTQRLEDDPHLGDFLKADIPGKDNGFDIEGLAIVGDRLLVGLRGPVLRGWATLLELCLAEEEPGILRLQKMPSRKERYQKHFLDLNGLGIRDLCVRDDTLLILAGPTMALDGAIKLFALKLADLESDTGIHHPRVELEVPYGQGCDRAEGITLLQPEQQELLVVYDAPAPERLQETGAVLADRIFL